MTTAKINATEVAKKIALAIAVIQATFDALELTENELVEFKNWVGHQEAFGAFIDPTAYRKHLQSGDFDEVGIRVDALLKFWRTNLSVNDRVGHEILKLSIETFLEQFMEQ